MPIPPKLRETLLYVYAIAAVATALWLFIDTVPDFDAAFRTVPGDGVIDWLGARGYVEHVNPFSAAGLARYNITAYGFGHPPTAPFWFIPTTRWGIEMLGICVAYLTLLLLTLHAVIIAYELRLPSPPATAALVVAAVISTSWFRDHLRMAQISEAIAFFYVLAWYFLRRGREASAGAMLGLATTFKLFPAVMVLFLLLTRRWRGFIAACSAWLVVAVIMTARYGLICWWQFFKLQGPIANYWICNVRNGSLQGIVLRLFRPACGLAGPTIPLATAIALLLSFALLAAAWWLTRAAARQRVDLPFALFSLLSVFVNPWSWEHYNVLLILPGLLLLAALLRGVGHGLPAWLTATTAALLATSVWLLHFDMILKRQRLNEYRANHTRSLHLQLHFYEVAAWLPQLLMGVAVVMLLLWQERRARQSPAAAPLLPLPAVDQRQPTSAS